jgi:thiamine-phosphate pyrophosphorylase
VALPPLCAIVDADIATRAGWTPPALARAYLAGGARFLQLRAKTAPSGLFLQWCDEIASAARAHDALLVVNDRFDIAWLAGVTGLHLGQDDLPVEVVRRALGPTALIGLSTHTPEQVGAALGQPTSYLAIGPVFGTATKETGYVPVGLDRVRAAAAAARGAPTARGVLAARGVPAARGTPTIPVVAIGGISLDRAESVIAAGATSVAVITDLLATADPEQRVRDYIESLRRLHGIPEQ